MTPNIPPSALELRSLVTSRGTLELSLQEVPVPAPAANQVLVRVEASPINPSDLGLLLAGTDVSLAVVTGSDDRPVVTIPLPEGALPRLAARVDKSLPVGTEGAGTVVAVGSEAAGKGLLGRTVAAAGGSMYAHYRTIDASSCLLLPEGTPASAGASAFVNPLTALGMVATMRREGHRGLVNTAAASNLGQMLVKLCLEDQVPLVSIVRKPEQEELLRELGATHVCNSTSSGFMADMIEALTATSATLAFDAIGGGRLVSQILTCMEAASNASATEYSRYGSTTHKQVYIYGALDTGPTVLTRSFGFAWGLGGWLLTPFLQSIGHEAVAELQARVAGGLATTFASTYTKEVSLAGALQPGALAIYAQQATGEKYLIAPILE